MVSTILKRSIAFSITAWLLVAVGVGDYSLHNFCRADNYIIAGIIIAPFALTLIMGAIHCLPKKSDYLEKESVPYILFKYSFQRNFDSDCCLAFYFLAFIFALRLDSKFITYGTVYIIACFLATMSDSGDYDSDAPDAIESERISKLKVFFLSLALTPIAGYIAVRMYKSEQNKKTEIMKRHLERAKAYLEAKDFTNAILECQEELNGTDEFDKLREGNFDQRKVRYDILHVLAEIYCEQEKYSEAIESYHKAMYIFPHDPHKAWDCVSSIVHSKWVYTNKGIAYKALGVLKDYEELYSDEEEFSKERIRLMKITEAELDIDEYENRARTYLAQGDYAKAIADYTKLIELASDLGRPYCYAMRAKVYLAQEDYAGATADYTKAIETAPDADSLAGMCTPFNKAYFYAERARGYFIQKDFESATADYTKAIETAHDADLSAGMCTPFNKAYFYAERARGYFIQKDFKSAIADYTKAIELDSEKSRYYRKRAEVYLAQKDYESAIADCTKAIELDSENSWGYTDRAEVYLAQKNYECAIADYTKAIKAFNSEEMEMKAQIYKERGEAYQMLGDTEKAEADFVKAKEIEAQE